MIPTSKSEGGCSQIMWVQETPVGRQEEMFVVIFLMHDTHR